MTAVGTRIVYSNAKTIVHHGRECDFRISYDINGSAGLSRSGLLSGSSLTFVRELVAALAAESVRLSREIDCSDKDPFNDTLNEPTGEWRVVCARSWNLYAAHFKFEPSDKKLVRMKDGLLQVERSSYLL